MNSLYLIKYLFLTNDLDNEHVSLRTKIEIKNFLDQH